MLRSCTPGGGSAAAAAAAESRGRPRTSCSPVPARTLESVLVLVLAPSSPGKVEGLALGAEAEMRAREGRRASRVEEEMRIMDVR